MLFKSSYKVGAELNRCVAAEPRFCSASSDGSVSIVLLTLCHYRMRYVATYLLAVLGGNTSPSAKDIKAILGSVGIEADDERLNKVFNSWQPFESLFPIANAACKVLNAAFSF